MPIALLTAMRSSLWVQAALLAASAAGCQGSDHDIEIAFQVTDETGGELEGAAVTCRGVRDVGDSQTFPGGEVVFHGGIDYSCFLEDGLYEMSITVRAGRDAYIDHGLGSLTDVPPLRVWRPEVVVEEVGDELIVSWDQGPSLPDEADGWVEQRLVVPGVDTWDLDPEVMQLAIPSALLDGVVEPELYFTSFFHGTGWLEHRTRNTPLAP